VTGVTWRELPADALEPPPLSVVRTGTSGNRWLRGEGDDWELLDGEHAGGVNGWAWVSRLVPVRLGEPIGYGRSEFVGEVQSWPGEVLSVEPSGYEIRDRALGHAVRLEAGMPDADSGDALAVARDFEKYLRGDEPGEG
jgi:hypothetical protein